MPSLKWIENRCAGAIDASDVAVVVAHPDDETIGCGALMSRLHNLNVVIVTDGAPRNGVNARRAGFATPPDYAKARARELRAALAIAGIAERQIFELGVRDGGVWHSLVPITHRLAHFFDERGIVTVFTHAFEGGHSDHDGVAYCVHAAAGMLRRRVSTLIEMPFYHLSAKGPAFQSFCDRDEGVVMRLTPAERRAKIAMFMAYASQKQVLAQFDPGVERYRIARRYDFRTPPNRGSIRYVVDAETGLGLPDWTPPQQGQKLSCGNPGKTYAGPSPKSWSTLRPRPERNRRAVLP